ncbi:MAG: hypothetical protein HY270_15075 [Deltaproteobacteria bacterium]|nr:hypothetical protein [Deltaproteobacteria bacterium]
MVALPILLDTDAGTDVDDVFRLIPDTGAPELDVAVDVDASRFVEFVMRRVLSLQ